MDDVALGRRLIAMGLVTQEAVRDAYTSLAAGQTLGQALVQRGHVSGDALARALQGDAGDVTAYSPPPGGGPVAGAPVQVGEVIDGRFRVDGALGEGGMGAVFKAFDLQRGVPVAVKVVLPQVAGGEALARFEREAQLAARVDRHAAIACVEAYGAHRGMPYCAMELVDGVELQALLEGGVDPLRLARVMEQIARALAACHRIGVVHRDVKPANILVTEDEQAKLVDFGIAVTADVERLTQTGALLGTPYYMAPEQADRAKDVDGLADVYAVGAILYHGLGGLPPFTGEVQGVLRALLLVDPPPPSRLRPGVPADLEAVCLKAMAKEKEDRYPDADALADDLARFAAGEPVRARPLSAWRRFRRRYRRGEGRAVALVRSAQALVVLGLVGALAGVYFVWAPAVADREVAWAEAALARGELGARGQELGFSAEELAAREASLRRVRFLLNAEKAPAADRALTVLDAYARLLAVRRGEAVRVPRSTRDRAPADVVVDALAEEQQGQPERALKRLDAFLEGEGARSTFAPALILRLRLLAACGDPSAAIGEARALYAESAVERAFVQEQAQAAIWRGYASAIEDAAELERGALRARLTPLVGATRDLELGTDWLKEPKRAALERAAPTWTPQVEAAGRALRRGDRSKIVSLVYRLGDIVRWTAPAIEPGPEVRALELRLEEKALDPYWELADKRDSSRGEQERQLASTAIRVGQLLYYQVDPQRRASPRFYPLLRELMILRASQGAELEFLLALLRSNFEGTELVPSNRKLINAIDPSDAKKKIDEQLEQLAIERPRSLAIPFVRLLVRRERGEHTDPDLCREMIAQARALLAAEDPIPDLADVYLAEARLLLARLLLRLTTSEGNGLSDEQERGLLEESLRVGREARPRAARFHWMAALGDEDQVLRHLDRKQERLQLWEGAVARLREEMSQGRVVIVDKELSDSLLRLSETLATLERGEDARARADEALRICLRSTHRGVTYRARALVARYALDDGDVARARDALGALDDEGLEDSDGYAEAWTRYAIATRDAELAERCIAGGLRGNPHNENLKGMREEVATMGGQ